MRAFSGRTVIAWFVAVALSLLLFTYFSTSPYIFALGLVLGAYLAQIATFKAGVLFGVLAALPLGIFAVFWAGLLPPGSSVASIILNVILVVAFGGVYCGVVSWLIQRLKHGHVYFP